MEEYQFFQPTDDVNRIVSDFVNAFGGDGYNMLLIRTALDKWKREADAGDKDAAQLVEVTTSFHKLVCVIMKNGRFSE